MHRAGGLRRLTQACPRTRELPAVRHYGSQLPVEVRDAFDQLARVSLRLFERD